MWQDPVKRLDYLKEAVGLFAQARQRNPDSAVVIGNQAYAAWLLGDAKLAEDSFRQALRARTDGGEAIYKATLGDLELHPVPEDAGFRTLIERLWAEHSKGG